jgi:two-component system CheB/CheR fusion protein
VSDLLDVTRIHRGKIQYNYENFNLKDFVKETVEEQKLTMPNNHIVVKKINDTVIKADKFRIYQVLTNLLSNAAKYSPPESTITVSTAKKNGYVSIHVKDEGVGVPDEHKKQIFDRFYQVQKSGKGSYPGLGMGLYISHEIIKHHGGKIYVENNAGPGSTFSFQLPVNQTQEQLP